MGLCIILEALRQSPGFRRPLSATILHTAFLTTNSRDLESHLGSLTWLKDSLWLCLLIWRMFGDFSFLYSTGISLCFNLAFSLSLWSLRVNICFMVIYFLVFVSPCSHHTHASPLFVYILKVNPSTSSSTCGISFLIFTFRWSYDGLLSTALTCPLLLMNELEHFFVLQLNTEKWLLKSLTSSWVHNFLSD